MKFQLGPVLGIDAEYRYTVCVLLKKSEKVNPADFLLRTASDHGYEAATHAESVTPLLDHNFYRFSFDIPAIKKAYSIIYFIANKGEKVSDRHHRTEWKFEVPGTDKLPKIGYSSCNGDSTRHPSKIEAKEFAMWERMEQSHEKDPFHILLMGGDQIYADSIWEEVSAIKNLKVEAEGVYERWRNSSKNRDLKKLTTDAVSEYEIPESQQANFIKELEYYYEHLYIDSWANIYMSYMLASVPSMMMWDDHDIFDGWGSHVDKIQRSDIFKSIFSVAKKYFEIFQIRTADNQSLFSSFQKYKHYSMHLTLRSAEIIVLDNRSFRTRTQIMSERQYRDLEKVLQKSLFQQVPKNLRKQKVLCLVIPVPVAHLDYSDMAESLLDLFKRNDFRHTLCDDAIDHWDHVNHTAEQKRILDTIFDAGRNEENNPYYVCIISGDVHSAGAATITHDETNDKITQLISSGMVHIPPTDTQGLAIGWVSRTLSSIAGYTLDLKNYGDYKVQTINARNFGYLAKLPRFGVKAYLEIEGTGGTLAAERQLNKFSNPKKSKK